MANQKEMNFPFYDIDISVNEEGWNKELPDCGEICNQACAATLSAKEMNEHASDTEVSILLTNDLEIKELNKKFRSKDKPTNVLSFPSEDLTPESLAELRLNKHLILGDIALSLETIKREAEEQNKTLKDHVSHLVVHATMHLLGYNHKKDSEAEIMEALEIRILQGIGIANPYETNEVE